MWDQIYELVSEIVNNIAYPSDPDKEDLIQDICMILLNISEDEITRMHESDELRYYIARVVTNNIKSKTSPYYYKYKKHHKHEINLIDPNEQGSTSFIIH